MNPHAYDGQLYLIGDRLNAEGSRRVKRLLLAADDDGVVDVAREQVAAGAHAIDVCVAMRGHGDEPELMERVVRRISAEIDVPLAIDSTDPHVIAGALDVVRVPPIINSILLRNGREQIDRVVPLALRSGAALIALPFDDAGPARTTERRVRVASAIFDAVVRDHGVTPEALIVDALAFPVLEDATSARDTLEGIRAIRRELPDVRLTVGVSDVSFGLPPATRVVLNAVFLHHCVLAGIDVAIADVAQLRPYEQLDSLERQLADNVVLNRTPHALQTLVAHFGAGTN